MFIVTEYAALIFAASKFGDFKRLINWHSLILAVSQFNALLKSFSILIWATVTGKNMLPMGSIFFPLMLALLRMWLSHHGNILYH